MKTFTHQLAPLVDRAGGSKKAAEVLGITPQCLNRWLAGKDPSRVTQVGALALLCDHKPEKKP